MKSLFFSIIILFSAIFTYAQQAPIALHSGSKVSFFNTLNDAYKAAVDGDIVYLPSGSFRMDNPLEKRLNIFGVGWRSDSSRAVGGETFIITDFRINKKGSNSLLSGLNLNQTLFFSDTISNFIIERSKLAKVSVNTNQGHYSNSLFFNECFIDYIYIPEYSITEFNNCIVAQRIDGRQTGIVRFRNSILLSTKDYGLVYNRFYISNSILFAGKEHGYELSYYATVEEITNTLIIAEANRVKFPLSGIGNLRKEQTERDNIFINYTGGTFLNEMDFHPKPSCNCSDRGVYSGSGNFRAIPPVHIAAKNVQSSTNNNTLKFNFRVITDK